MRDRISTILAALSATGLLTGCSFLGASYAVTDAALATRTESALGLAAGEFTISDRVDEGTTTRYKVSTAEGRRFNCFVGGALSVMGKTVSEAVCTPMGAPAAASSAGSSAPCDALRRAAKQC